MRRFKHNLLRASACYITDGNLNPGGAGGTPPANGENSGNNAGTPDPLTSFWDDPAPPQQQQQQQQTQAPDGNQTPPTPFAAVQAMMDGFKPAGFLDAKVIGDMGENKFESFNEGLAQHGQAVLQQSAQVTTGILKEVVPQLFAQMRQMIESQLQGSDNTKFIADNLPQSQDPRFRRQVTQVFEQSMKHSGGDKTKALAMTKSMLAAMGETFAPPSNDPPPPSRGKNLDWFNELGVHLTDNNS